MSCPRYAFVLCAAAAAAPGQQPKVTITPEIYPCDDVTVHGDARWQAARVVDAMTGAPIAGAELLLVAESRHPMRGEMWWQLRAVADADGFVRLRSDEQAPGYVPWSWVVVRAKGYGPAMQMNCAPAPVVRLARGQELPVRVCNWRGEGVPDALIGACSGCGHTPDLVHARTDAAGIARLVDVDPHNGIFDLYVEHAALHYGYDSVPWHPGQGPADFFVRPGVATLGIVVGADGKAIADAYVGDKDVHRGPWAHTAADGSFRLYGSAKGGDLWVHIGERELLFERPPLQPFRLEVPPPDGERTQVVNLPEVRGQTGAETIVLRVVDANGRALANQDVQIVGGQDTWSEDGEVRARLSPGRHEVIATGDDHGDLRTTIDVRAGAENAFVLRPPPLPTCRVRVPDLPDDVSVLLGTDAHRRDITDQVHSGAPVGLPEAACWLVLADRTSRRAFLVDRAAALASGLVRVTWFPPTRVEGTLADRDGKPLAATLTLHPIGQHVHDFVDRDAKDLPQLDTKGQFSLPTTHVGLAMLAIRHGGSPQPDHVPVMLPPRADGAVVDLGTLVLGGAPRLLIRDAAGEVPEGLEVGLVRAGWHDVREAAPRFPLDRHGEWHGPVPRAGDAIEVQAKSTEATDGTPAVIDLRVLFPLAGDGPWTLQLPAGQVDLDVRDEPGQPREPVAPKVVTPHAWASVQGPTRLRRLPPGPQRWFVAAAGRQSAIVDVDVPATGHVRVDVVLPPR